MMDDQRTIQIWNDAVAACEKALMDAIFEEERKACNGLPNPARVFVRHIGAQRKPGDERQTLPLPPSNSKQLRH